VVGKAGDLLVWHGWLQHAGSTRSADVEPFFPRMALLGSFRNHTMENSGPPVFFEPTDGSSPRTATRSVALSLFQSSSGLIGIGRRELGPFKLAILFSGLFQPIRLKHSLCG
jgi:hypothetical protein